MTIRIIVADALDVVRRGLRDILRAHDKLVVVAETADGPEAISLCRTLRPEVLVLDLTLPGLPGVEVVRCVRLAVPETEVLAVTGFDDEDLVREAAEAGARGHVRKAEAAAHVMAAVLALASHLS